MYTLNPNTLIHTIGFQSGAFGRTRIHVIMSCLKASLIIITCEVPPTTNQSITPTEVYRCSFVGINIVTSLCARCADQQYSDGSLREVIALPGYTFHFERIQPL